MSCPAKCNVSRATFYCSVQTSLMKSVHLNLEQEFGLAEGVTVSQCVIHNSKESVIPRPAFPCVYVLHLCPPTHFMVMRSVTPTRINRLVCKSRTK